MWLLWKSILYSTKWSHCKLIWRSVAHKLYHSILNELAETWKDDKLWVWYQQIATPLHCNHNERDGVSNHRCLDCLPNRLFRRRSKKTSKRCVTGLCEWNSPVTGQFPSQRAMFCHHANSDSPMIIGWCHYKCQSDILKVGIRGVTL